MDAGLAESIVTGLAMYLGAGLIFALVFVVFLIKPFDANAAKGAPIQFRLLIFPGVVALWPFLLIQFFKRITMGAGQ